MSIVMPYQQEITTLVVKIGFGLFMDGFDIRYNIVLADSDNHWIIHNTDLP